MSKIEEVLLVEGLSYKYADGNLAVNSVSFTVKAGQRIGIVGGNGAGKSTLLLLLCGLLEADQGSIEICGQVLNKSSFRSLCMKLGFVFQNSEDQLFTNSVYEDVAYAPKHAGLAPEEIEKLVKKTLQAVQIEHLAKRSPHRLSGGEQRLAALATALVLNPEILILDEPTTGLDPSARRNLIQLLNGLEHTRLITSHDMDFIWDVCDTVILMKDGTIEAFGATKQVLSDQSLLERCRLELPYRLQHCPNCSV